MFEWNGIGMGDSTINSEIQSGKRDEDRHHQSDELPAASSAAWSTAANVWVSAATEHLRLTRDS